MKPLPPLKEPGRWTQAFIIVIITTTGASVLASLILWMNGLSAPPAAQAPPVHASDSPSRPVPAVMKWDPKPDITVHELSQCLPLVVMEGTREMLFALYSGLPPEAQRHITLTWEAGKK